MKSYLLPLSLVALLSGSVLMTACGDEEPAPAAKPAVEAPAKDAKVADKSAEGKMEPAEGDDDEKEGAEGDEAAEGEGGEGGGAATDAAPASGEKVGGGDLVFTNDALGKVTFSHAKHAARGAGCEGCHPDPFAMKFAPGTKTMADMNAGKFCGKCHGAAGPGFPTQGDCTKCHVK